MVASCSKGDLATGRTYWGLWGVPLVGILVGASVAGSTQAIPWTLGFLVMGVACVVNAARCGRLHCFITGPLFLAAALVSALNGLALLSVSWPRLGAAVLVGFVLAHIPERVRGTYVAG